MNKGKVEILSKEICNGCKTRHKCDTECCIMADVVAEWLNEKGYGNVAQFADVLIKDYECLSNIGNLTVANFKELIEVRLKDFI